MKVLCIVGLPASGKTTLIETLRTPDDYVIDDFSTYKKMEEALTSGRERLILSDPYMCDPDIFLKIVEFLKSFKFVHLEFIFFENDGEQCLINAKNRPEKQVSGFIKYLTKVYNPPRVDKKVYKEV